MGYFALLFTSGIESINMRNVYLFAMIGVIVLLSLFFFLYENSHTVVERAVLTSLLTALSAAGRILFTALPSVQPSSFIIIMTGVTLGRETGFMTGALTALLSSLLLGLGPWTPWQMLAWGLMGWLAGVMAKPLASKKVLRVAYGIIWGFLFGWIMNIWMLMSIDNIETGFAYIVGVYAASFLFDALHAAANGLLIALGGDAFMQVLVRASVKYGLTKKHDFAS